MVLPLLDVPETYQEAQREGVLLLVGAIAAALNHAAGRT
jgi:hypothetical protein